MWYEKSNPSLTGQQYQHRVVAEQALGRPLKSHEVVHHIDNNKQNNEKSNLLICSQKYHMEIHAREKILNLGFDPNIFAYCSHHKTCHPKTEFTKSKRTWNGLHNLCKTIKNSLYGYKP